MVTSKSSSFFQDLRSRELNGFRVRKRPCFSDAVSGFSEIGAIATEHSGDQTPPLAASFCKTSKNSHILAVSDEAGYVTLFDTRRKLSTSASYQENAERARVCEWVAHPNAVFDVCWIKENSQLLTASGDQTIKLWDIQQKKCKGILTGHTGSVKSMCSHPTNPDTITSGSRDGSFAIWDLRISSCSRIKRGELGMLPAVLVNGAHLPLKAKRVRRSKAVSVSITSVLYLNDGFTIATAGAVDSVVKFWDTRNTKSSVTQTSPHRTYSGKERSHGISSLSQDLNGMFLSASCMDNRIYLYNVLQPDKGPVNTFSGCQIESFYVKSAISPDSSHILSGSSDGNAYIWKVDRPHQEPIRLENHDAEVTAVDWCSFDLGKIATAADDSTIRLWNPQNTYCSNSRAPRSTRKRVMALPTQPSRSLLVDESMDIEKASISLSPSEVVYNTTISITMPKISTPKGQEKIFLSDSDTSEAVDQKTPEAALKSPSSVLNPPSSLKRKTIRDYFLAAS